MTKQQQQLVEEFATLLEKNSWSGRKDGMEFLPVHIIR